MKQWVGVTLVPPLPYSTIESKMIGEDQNDGRNSERERDQPQQPLIPKKLQTVWNLLGKTALVETDEYDQSKGKRCLIPFSHDVKQTR